MLMTCQHLLITTIISSQLKQQKLLLHYITFLIVVSLLKSFQFIHFSWCCN